MGGTISSIFNSNEEEERRLEQQRVERRRQYNERLQQQRLYDQRTIENQRLENQNMENQRLARQRLERQQLEQQQLERQRLERQRLERLRLAQQQQLDQQLERQRLETLRLERLRLDQQQLGHHQQLDQQFSRLSLGHPAQPTSYRATRYGEHSSERSNARFPCTAMVVGKMGKNIYIEAEIDNQFCYLIINERSRSNGDVIGQPMLWLCANIKINSAERLPSFATPTVSAEWAVLSYELCEGEREPSSYAQIVTVHKTLKKSLMVVGKDFARPAQVAIGDLQKIREQDFLVATFMQLPLFSKIEYIDESAFVKVDREAKTKYYRMCELHAYDDEDHPMPVCPRRISHITQLRQLTKKEKDMACLYIRDPLVAAARLEKYEAHLEAVKHTVQVPVKMFVDQRNNRHVVTCTLNAKQIEDCIKSRSGDSWKLGSELSFRHSALAKYERHQQEAAVVVDDIRFDGDTAWVRLVGVARSKDLFEVLRLAKTAEDALCHIGPSDDELSQESMPDYIDAGFDQFFTKRRDLFDAWTGRSTYGSTDIDRCAEPFKVKDRWLDPSQQISMRAAAALPGWTCVAAPPGSGKTFMISALVAARSKESGDTHPGRIVISATTNVAVTNAIDAVHQHFPEIKVCREYSQRTESEVPALSAKLSLRRMTKLASQYLSEAEMKKLEKHLAILRAAEAAMLRPCDSIATGMKRLNALRGAEKMLRMAFKKTYQPLVYGSTAELVARNPDDTATHLILDEAAQMSPLAALAIYVSMPNLQKITLLGDSQQLGPYCGLEQEGAARAILMQGELTRQEALATSHKKKLLTIYRCHPRIVDLMLRPLYGPGLLAGTKAVDRALIQQKTLPAAKDGSPVLFVNIENSNGEFGSNQKELEVAMELIRMVTKAGIEGEDVAVITHHRAQREKLIRELKGMGSIGTLGLPVGVYTIDSFQGKEAKVAIVLTTKTSKSKDQRSLNHALSFVSNPNRETVAVSRAQHGLYVLGDWAGLARTPFWNQFGEKLKQAGAIVDESFKPIENPAWFDAQNKRAKNSANTAGSQAQQASWKKKNNNGHGDNKGNKGQPRQPGTNKKKKWNGNKINKNTKENVMVAVL